MGSERQPRRGPDREPDALSLALRSFMEAARAAEDGMARRLGVTTTDLDAVTLLIEGEPMGPVELGERLGIRSASATALADRLEANRHAERRPHPSDRRRVVLVPTEHAVQEAWRALMPLLEAVDAAHDGFSEEERAVVTRYLHEVGEALQRSSRA